MVSPQTGGVYLLYDFQYTIPGGKKDPVFLKAGEDYRLVERKTDRWIAITRPDRKDVFYVPASYIEEVRSVSPQPQMPTNNINRTIPPRLPIKPKNLFEKMQKDLKIEPPTPPAIDDDARIELFNILSGNFHKLASSTTTTPTEHKLTSHGEAFDFNKTTTKKPSLNNSPTNDYSFTKNPLSENVFNNGEVDELDKIVDHQSPLKQQQHNSGNMVKMINGYEVYIDEMTGKKYYHNPKTKVSTWTLPHQADEFSSNYVNLNDSPDTLKRNLDSSTDSDKNPKIGQINRLKFSENGRKLKKNWTQCLMLLDGSNLYFFKDQKSTANKSKSEISIDLSSSFVMKGSTSNKQNLIQVITSTGTEYMLQSDDQDVINDWFESLTHATKLNNSKTKETVVSSLKNEENNIPKPKKGSSIQQQDVNLGSYQDLSKSPLGPSMTSLANNSTANSTNTLEKSKFKEKLKLWLLKRPTKEMLREKGIYKDGIFGSSLSSICEKEGSEIPLFVAHCIEAVEERGLYVDGIYRANGNMAEIQKLRFAVNTNGSQSLLTSSSSSSSPLPDIHVITGALKLFFRELQEPLFPYEHYNSIMNVIYSKSRAQSIKNILASLPRVNYLTLTVLLQHLLIVVSHSSENRMHIQNLSIIFGPTLMWPKESDDQNLAVSMVMRSQLVDMLLQDYSFFFDSVI